MPIYEYTCKDCGKSSELIVSSETQISCEHCGSKKLKRELSSFAFSRGGSSSPACAPSCAGGFEQGQCGSGMCSGGH